MHIVINIVVLALFIGAVAYMLQGILVVVISLGLFTRHIIHKLIFKEKS